MSVPQDASKNPQGSNNKEQKVIVLSMKNMSSFKFDVTKSLLSSNQDNGQQVFNFKPQQLLQSSPSSTQIHVTQPKQNNTNIQVSSQQITQANSPIQKITGTAGTILIRAQSSTAVPKQMKSQQQQLSLIGHPNIKIQEASQVGKISSEITMKNQAGQTVLISNQSTAKNQPVSISPIPIAATQHSKILLPVTNSSSTGYQTIIQIPKQKTIAKQQVKIIQSTVKESKPIPILPKPDAQKIVLQQQVIMPTSSQQSFVIVQQTPSNPSQVKSNVITIPGSTCSKTNIPQQQSQTKWGLPAVSNLSFPPALSPIQPKVSLATNQQKVQTHEEKTDKINVLMEINENYYSSSESESIENFNDGKNKSKDLVKNDEIQDKTPEKIASEEEEQFTMVKRIIEGDDDIIGKLSDKTNSNNDEISHIENILSENETRQTKNLATDPATRSNSNNSMLLCDEQISSITPEESPESSNKSKEQVTPVHLNKETSNKNQSVEEVKRNLKMDLISANNSPQDEIKIDIDENDSVISDDHSNHSSIIDEKKNINDSLPTRTDTLPNEATTSKSDQNRAKRNRKPKNRTVNTSLGLPYKPPQPNSRKKKVEKKVELEMDFHDPLNKILWEDGIGGLNNCNKLFGFNEFGLIEVLNKKDATAKLKSYEGNTSNIDDNGNFKFRKIVDPQDQFVCFVCNKYGTVRDFFSPECCSESCFAITKRKTTDLSSTSKDENNDSGLNTSTDTKKVMFEGAMIPLQQLHEILLEKHLPESKRTKKGSQRKFSFSVPEVKFSWDAYLTSKSIPAPDHLFIYTAKTAITDFRVGMKLEAIDPKNQHMFCVCTVDEKLGCRIKLHFDGFPASYDFWTNSDSFNIFPAGFCQSTGRKLIVPPKWNNNKKFDWTEYLDHTNSIGAQRYMFSRLKSTEIDDECPLTLGMKLEVKREEHWYAATIIDIINSRILIRFDGVYESFGCHWFNIDSPYLNDCDGLKSHDNGNGVKPPNGDDDVKFNWIEYLAETKSIAVPKHYILNKSRQPYNFEPGMKLEVVDVVNPQLIRPATILNQNGYRIQVVFDGFDINYAYWIEDDSEDIHPINYCKLTEHPIEHPAGASKLTTSALCSMIGCRGIGNGLYPERYFHDTSKECPYNINNWNRLLEHKDNTRLDYKPYIKRSKLQSTNGEEVLEKNRSLLIQNPLSKRIKKRNQEIVTKEDPDLSQVETLDDTEKVTKKCLKKRKIDPPTVTEEDVKHEPDEHKSVKVKVVQHFLEDYGPQMNYAYDLWTKNSKILETASITENDLTDNPIKWSIDDVCTYLVKFCDEETTAKFYAQRIDGEALLSLCQKDLISLMNIKVGPAVKIYNRILWLRQEVMTKFTEF